MDWSILFAILESYAISDFYKNFIFHYLIDRNVVFVDGTINTERQCFMGYPQGSVIAPGIWNIYINKILELNTEEFFVQAFADDSALVTTGRNRKELEGNTNRLLALISDKLEELKLNLSVDECQALAIRSKQNNIRQRARRSTFIRAPCFKLMTGALN
ncbi:hypothetical protein AVEN_145437-1 [Araneus ventricosus]|uniref:Reverse transcriptase domain-containing protein n=1 Tax=Araneus ventricosus TaxID=182803 RepID=A0A4Y2X9L3_ARAVE|nr:hypothetical protein AVEN_145437-1 [Araneus ventricosus]